MTRHSSRSLAPFLLAALLSGCGGTVQFQDDTALSIRVKPPVKEEPKRVEVKDDHLEIREKIQFRKGEAVILAQSHGLLDEIVAVIQANPDITKIAIEGHTSSEGGQDLNRRLSRWRAEAVLKYLVSKGVAADRLTSNGFGPDKPIASNDTEADREKNRRVEFNITARDDSKKAK